MELVDILVAQFILSYKKNFFDQVVGEMRTELRMNCPVSAEPRSTDALLVRKVLENHMKSGGLLLLQKVSGPRARGADCGFYRLRVQT